MFHFTIRDVLWLTVVVAVLCAWWLDHQHKRFVMFENVIMKSGLKLREQLTEKRWQDLNERLRLRTKNDTADPRA